MSKSTLTCPPCHGDCRQGRDCPQLVTKEGGRRFDSAIHEAPTLRPRQYQPDYGIEHTRVTNEPTPLLKWILGIGAVVLFVIYAIRNA
jgi:hypothetical protein